MRPGKPHRSRLKLITLIGFLSQLGESVKKYALGSGSRSDFFPALVSFFQKLFGSLKTSKFPLKPVLIRLKTFLSRTNLVSA